MADQDDLVREGTPHIAEEQPAATETELSADTQTAPAETSSETDTVQVLNFFDLEDGEQPSIETVERPVETPAYEGFEIPESFTREELDNNPEFQAALAEAGREIYKLYDMSNYATMGTRPHVDDMSDREIIDWTLKFMRTSDTQWLGWDAITNRLKAGRGISPMALATSGAAGGNMPSGTLGMRAMSEGANPQQQAALAFLKNSYEAYNDHDGAYILSTVLAPENLFSMAVAGAGTAVVKGITWMPKLAKIGTAALGYLGEMGGFGFADNRLRETINKNLGLEHDLSLRKGVIAAGQSIAGGLFFAGLLKSPGAARGAGRFVSRSRLGRAFSEAVAEPVAARAGAFRRGANDLIDGVEARINATWDRQVAPNLTRAWTASVNGAVNFAQDFSTAFTAATREHAANASVFPNPFAAFKHWRAARAARAAGTAPIPHSPPEVAPGVHLDIPAPQRTWLQKFLNNPYYKIRSMFPGQDQPAKWLPNYLSGYRWLKSIGDTMDDAAGAHKLIDPINETNQKLMQIVLDFRDGKIKTADDAARAAEGEVLAFASRYRTELAAYADSLDKMLAEVERYANQPYRPDAPETQIVGPGLYGKSKGVAPGKTMGDPTELPEHFGISNREYVAIRENLMDLRETVRSLTTGEFFDNYLKNPEAPGFSNRDAMSHFILEDFRKIAEIGTDGAARLQDRTADRLVTQSLDWRRPLSLLNPLNYINIIRGWGKRETPIQFLRMRERNWQQGYYNEHRRFPSKGKQLWEGPEDSKNIERNSFILTAFSEINKRKNDGVLKYDGPSDYPRVFGLIDEIYWLWSDPDGLRAAENLRDRAGDYGLDTWDTAFREKFTDALDRAIEDGNLHYAKFLRYVLDIRARESVNKYGDRYAHKAAMEIYEWPYKMRQFSWTSEVSTPWKDRWIRIPVFNTLKKWWTGIWGAPSKEVISPSGEPTGAVTPDWGKYRFWLLQPKPAEDALKDKGFLSSFAAKTIDRTPGFVTLATGGLTTRRGLAIYGGLGALGLARGFFSDEGYNLEETWGYKLWKFNIKPAKVVYGSMQGFFVDGAKGWWEAVEDDGWMNISGITSGLSGAWSGGVGGLLGTRDVFPYGKIEELIEAGDNDQPSAPSDPGPGGGSGDVEESSESLSEGVEAYRKKYGSGNGRPQSEAPAPSAPQPETSPAPQPAPAEPPAEDNSLEALREKYRDKYKTSDADGMSKIDLFGSNKDTIAGMAATAAGRDKNITAQPLSDRRA